MAAHQHSAAQLYTNLRGTVESMRKAAVKANSAGFKDTARHMECAAFGMMLGHDFRDEMLTLMMKWRDDADFQSPAKGGWDRFHEREKVLVLALLDSVYAKSHGAASNTEEAGPEQASDEA